jgi:tyrosine-protein phosphatase SIW14
MKIYLHKTIQLTLPVAAIMSLLGFLGIGCQSDHSCQTVHPKVAQNNLTPTGVPIFAKVSEGLYRGGQPSEQGFAQLRKMGIRTVVSLRVFNSNKKLLSEMGFRQFHISCKNLHPEEEDLIEFLRIVTEPANQPVFVHCRDGTDRTGMMVAVYRMVVQDWPLHEALAEMKAFGFNEIWDSLEDYVEELDIAQIKSKLAAANKPNNIAAMPQTGL